MSEPMFWWTERQRELQREASEFADSLRDLSREIMWTREYPWEPMREIAARGWLGAGIPGTYGGTAETFGGVTELTILAEELGRVWPATWPFTITAFGGTKQIVDTGTEEQKQRWLPRIASGEVLGALCMTEPFTGSDALGMETRATRTDGGYMITGKKRFISNLGAAGLYVVYAITDGRDSDRERRERGHLSVFIVEKDTPGLSVERYHELGGYGYVRNGILDFRGVEVPESHRLGEEGDGWPIMTSGLNLERTLSAAGSVGNMREALRYADTYARRRIQFDRPVADYYAVHSKIAEAIIRVRMDRLFIHATAASADRGDETSLDAAIGKLVAARDGVDACLDMVQSMGGDGATRYYPVEQLARDMTIKGIGAGTNEIMAGLVYRLARKQIPDDLSMDLRGYFPEKLRSQNGAAPETAGVADRILHELADQYVGNPGLHVDLPDVAAALGLEPEAINDALLSLVESGDVVVWPSVERPKLVRPTYQGLTRSHDADWYRLAAPEWVGPRERIGLG